MSAIRGGTGLGPDYVGPCKIDCPRECDVPPGAEMSMVPRPRHAWSDVINCPNEDCERSFLLTRRPAP